MFKMKPATVACVLVALVALIQLPAFDARDLKDGTHLDVDHEHDMRVGCHTCAQH